jgi:hypothetical protein
MIKYKEIDAYTDLIIATTGNPIINYNRIVSSSISPYAVTDKKIFRDPNSSLTRRLYALYIIDLNNAVSLIYDTTIAASPQTEIATINFLGPSISYQKAFPPIIGLSSAIFTSPTVFYTGSDDVKFYTD